MSKCKAGYFAELELRNMERHGTLVKNGRELRVIKAEIEAGNDARIEEIVTLMMKFPVLSKLHSDMLKAGAVVLMRIDM